jgi:hypothetical protein
MNELLIGSELELGRPEKLFARRTETWFDGCIFFGCNKIFNYGSANILEQSLRR